MVSTRISTKLSDQSGFDNEPCIKLFMSLMQMKGYTYMITVEGKVSGESSHIVHSSQST